MGAVDVGSVEKRDAGVDGVVDEFDHIGLGLRRAVEGGHGHAAQPLFRHLKALRSELHFRHIHSHLD